MSTKKKHTEAMSQVLHPGMGSGYTGGGPTIQINGGYVTSGCVPGPPTPPLTESIDRLDGRLNVLAEKFERLAAKLDPVMTMAPACGVCSPSQARPVRSVVVDRLDSLSGRVAMICERVSECLDRLEV